MKVIKIKSVLASVLFAGFVVGVGTGSSQEKKQAALKVTLEELAKDPVKYQGKLVQVEGVIQQTQILKEKQGEFDYRLAVGKNDFLLAWCAGKLAVSKGDTVRITGTFRHSTAAANSFQILADSKNGKVEKTTPKKLESTPPTGATHLKKIDRSITKEPKYSSQPYYALLVIGPDAAKRIWLVLDGDVLYVDRNGNGDLTEASERVNLDVEATKIIKVAPGEYRAMNVFKIEDVSGIRLELMHWIRDRKFVPEMNEPKVLREFRNERQENGWENASLYRLTKDDRAQIPVLFCPRPKDAQITHLNGPLTFTPRSNEPLKHGAKENLFDVSIGTPGLPTKHSRHPCFAPLTTTEVPADVHPRATFEFPHKDPGKAPIKIDVTLDRRC